MPQTLFIKNMVCDRCKMAVGHILQEQGLHAENIDLGTVVIAEQQLTETQKQKLAKALEAMGFELLGDKRQQLLERIKSTIVTLVHYQPQGRRLTLSAYLSQELHADYSGLSKLFSECTGMTIERFYMLQRIERVKQLLKYGELTLTQIAMQMDYSSVAYLSSQFKSVTGMTPSQFKQLGKNTLVPLDKI